MCVWEETAWRTRKHEQRGGGGSSRHTALRDLAAPMGIGSRPGTVALSREMLSDPSPSRGACNLLQEAAHLSQAGDVGTGSTGA